jgi:hypothetical protein
MRLDTAIRDAIPVTSRNSRACGAGCRTCGCSSCPLPLSSLDTGYGSSCWWSFALLIGSLGCSPRTRNRSPGTSNHRRHAPVALDAACRHRAAAVAGRPGKHAGDLLLQPSVWTRYGISRYPHPVDRRAGTFDVRLRRKPVHYTEVQFLCAAKRRDFHRLQSTTA